jgi:hypothetical protein
MNIAPLTDERLETHALQPHCPFEPLVGPTRLELEIVKSEDGYDFIERDLVTGCEIEVVHFPTFVGRRAAIAENHGIA